MSEPTMMPVPKWRLGDKFTIEDTRGHRQWEIVDQPWVNNGEWWYPARVTRQLNFPERELVERDESMDEAMARMAKEEDDEG